ARPGHVRAPALRGVLAVWAGARVFERRSRRLRRPLPHLRQRRREPGSREGSMKFRLSVLTTLCVALVASIATATAARPLAVAAPRYYLALGDSLAASYQPNGDLTHGYAEQLYAALTTDQTALRLVKLGCPGESTASMRYGVQDPTRVLSCMTHAGGKQRYRHATQLAEAVSFLETHRGEVALVTIDIGGNDLQHLDANGNVVFCPLTRTGCGTRMSAMAR